MTRKPRHVPSSLTVMGIYMRHIGRSLGEGEGSEFAVDIMPVGGIISVDLTHLPPAFREAPTWEALDKAASSEVGQPLKTTLDGDNAVVRQAPV